MKANLGEREPSFLAHWDKEKIYETILKQNGRKPRFIFHDGPPYANGHIHYGTILNKILKDIVVKYQNMSGHYCEFIPGWDCHGLPIELQVDKKLASKKKNMSPIEIRQACRDYAKEFIDIQRCEFKRLGCLGDWENPYLTMSPQYEATIARELGRFVEKGYLYRGKKPVYWCPSCRTALAEAEVEYEDHTSPSIYVKFFLTKEDRQKIAWAKDKEPICLVIWTTTPWTLPANLGISLHPQFTYAALRTGKEIWIIADGLLNDFVKAVGLQEYQVVTKLSGKELEGLRCQHPFLSRDSLVMLGDHVTLEAGTGCVHTAPGHGQEDYVIGQKYGLKPLAPIDAGGRFTEEGGLDWLVGKKVEEADPLILDHLKEKGTLIQAEKTRHSYPHCWRCKKPIVFRATEQWFIAMEHADLRKKTLQQIQKVTWVPKWGINRIVGMIENRPDWCVSRQRLWGVPIIAVICESCEQASTNPKLIEAVAKMFEGEKGSDAWFDLDLKKVLPKDFTCPHCHKKGPFRKEKDILDVWFDSGVSYVAVLEERCQLKEQADLYLEGSDQHRGWFHTSLLTSMATRGRPPYKTVLTHGFVVDAEGKKLSKSAQNYIPPENVLKSSGAEMLRLWVANEDYRNDIRFSEEILTRLSDSYRKIRNTCRYLLGNLYDFTPGQDEVPFHQLEEIDRWALHLLQDVIRRVRKHYESYEFHMISHSLTRFCAVELSALYFDILKDRLYTEAKKGTLRRGAQTVLFKILEVLVKLMAPILSFTAEEVWQAGPSFSKKPVSVFLNELPSPNPEWENRGLGERWERFFRMREGVTKALEVARAGKFLGNSLQARVVLEVSPDQAAFLKTFGKNLTDLFIVSEIVFGNASGEWVYCSEEMADFKVGIEKAGGAKCGRCWKYLPSVGKDQKHPELCQRCVDVVSSS